MNHLKCKQNVSPVFSAWERLPLLCSLEENAMYSFSQRQYSLVPPGAAVPNIFGTRGRFHGRQFCHGLGVEENGFGMIQVHDIYCALYFCYYYIVIYIEIITQLTIRLTGAELRRQCEQRGAAVNTDEALLACPPLTSCCAVRFLTGHGPVPIRGPGVGDLWAGGPLSSSENIYHLSIVGQALDFLHL